ncbi:MAG: helix-turn-helix domain-containing protein [Nitrososphaerales archaeon]
MLEERRKKAVQMVIDGALKEDVAKAVSASVTSVNNWYRAYVKGGSELDALDAGKHTGRPSRLNGPQLDRLGNMLLKGAEHYGYDVDLWTTERIAALIEEKFGVRYHPDHVRKILHGMEFTSQKAEGWAREYDEKKVRDWVRDTLPDIKKAG